MYTFSLDCMKYQIMSRVLVIMGLMGFAEPINFERRVVEPINFWVYSIENYILTLEGFEPINSDSRRANNIRIDGSWKMFTAKGIWNRIYTKTGAITQSFYNINGNCCAKGLSWFVKNFRGLGVFDPCPNVPATLYVN